jgi:hypothetical protein
MQPEHSLLAIWDVVVVLYKSGYGTYTMLCWSQGDGPSNHPMNVLGREATAGRQGYNANHHDEKTKREIVSNVMCMIRWPSSRIYFRVVIQLMHSRLLEITINRLLILSCIMPSRQIHCLVLQQIEARIRCQCPRELLLTSFCSPGEWYNLGETTKKHNMCVRRLMTLFARWWVAVANVFQEVPIADQKSQ